MRTTMLLLLAALAVAVLPATASAASCKLPSDGRGLGPTYTLKLTVTKTSCDGGKAVVKGWSRCSTAKGKAGRCTTKVQGYSCTEKRTTGPTQFDANVSCRKGASRVTFLYTQFT